MRGSGNFRQGGGGSRSVGRCFFVCFYCFFFLQKSNALVNFKEIYHFSRVPEGVQLFPGGSNCLFPIETHINCDFPAPVPPLDPHLTVFALLNLVHNVSKYMQQTLFRCFFPDAVRVILTNKYIMYTWRRYSDYWAKIGETESTPPSDNRN